LLILLHKYGVNFTASIKYYLISRWTHTMLIHVFFYSSCFLKLDNQFSNSTKKNDKNLSLYNWAFCFFRCVNHLLKCNDSATFTFNFHPRCLRFALQHCSFVIFQFSGIRTSCNKPATDLYSNAVPLTTCQQDVFALLVPSLLTSCQ
jgi:hypothetical protein